MRFDVCKVEWTKVFTNAFDVPILGETTTLYRVEATTINKEIGKVVDSFSLTLSLQPDNYIFEDITIGDRMKVYRSHDGGSTWTFEIQGTVKSKKISKDSTTKSFVISCLNVLEQLFGVITALPNTKTTTKTSDGWIRQIIREVNTVNGSATYTGGVTSDLSTAIVHIQHKYIYGGTLGEWNNVGNDTTSDKFQNIFTNGSEPAFQLIETLSDKEFSNSNHYYYLNDDNYFVWKKLPSSISGSAPTTYRSKKYDTQIIDVVNYVIVQCGKNLYDTFNVNTFKYDLASATEHGIKSKVVFAKGLAKEIRDLLNQAYTNEGIFSENNFPFPLSYPVGGLKLPWDVSTTVSTDSALNSAYIDEVLLRGEEYAQKYLNQTVKSTFDVVFDIYDDTEWFNTAQGALYNVAYPINVSQSKQLRVQKKGLTYTSEKGWSLGLFFKDDDRLRVLP